jgi:hypothetical protein
VPLFPHAVVETPRKTARFMWKRCVQICNFCEFELLQNDNSRRGGKMRHSVHANNPPFPRRFLHLLFY